MAMNGDNWCEAQVSAQTILDGLGGPEDYAGCVGVTLSPYADMSEGGGNELLCGEETACELRRRLQPHGLTVELGDYGLEICRSYTDEQARQVT